MTNERTPESGAGEPRFPVGRVIAQQTKAGATPVVHIDYGTSNRKANSRSEAAESAGFGKTSVLTVRFVTSFDCPVVVVFLQNPSTGSPIPVLRGVLCQLFRF